MMKLDFRQGLLFVSVTLSFNGKSHTVDDVILDTGAAHSLIDRTAGEPLDLVPDNDDIIVTMAGLGGNDYAVRKKIEHLDFAGCTISQPYLDFGNLDAHPGVNGLLGADILTAGRYVIDLDQMIVYPK